MINHEIDVDRFKERFDRLFPAKRLLAFRLNGFSHSLWYDDGNSASDVEQLWYSACAPESPYNTQEGKQLLGIYSHYLYQCDPRGYVYVSPDNR